MFVLAQVSSGSGSVQLGQGAAAAEKTLEDETSSEEDSPGQWERTTVRVKAGRCAAVCDKVQLTVSTLQGSECSCHQTILVDRTPEKVKKEKLFYEIIYFFPPWRYKTDQYGMLSEAFLFPKVVGSVKNKNSGKPLAFGSNSVVQLKRILDKNKKPKMESFLDACLEEECKIVYKHKSLYLLALAVSGFRQHLIWF